MTQHKVDLDLGGALAPPRTCPNCGSADLATETDDRGVSFNCLGCRQSWMPIMGMLVAVTEDAP